MAQIFHVQAHRGASLEERENTLESVVCAALMGVQSIEVDVQLTADSIPILFHDFLIKPASEPNYGAPRPVGECRFESLEKVSTLDSVLKKLKTLALPDFKWLDLELKLEPKLTNKAKKDLIIEKVLSQVLREWDLKRTAFRSFDWEILRRLKKVCAEARIIPLLDKSEKDFSEALEMRVEWLAPCVSSLTLENLKKAHASGVRVMPYTVNEPKKWGELISWGVDGMTTDNPRALLEFLRKKN